jgi:hypothetical protein
MKCHSLFSFLLGPDEERDGSKIDSGVLKAAADLFERQDRLGRYTLRSLLALTVCGVECT